MKLFLLGLLAIAMYIIATHTSQVTSSAKGLLVTAVLFSMNVGLFWLMFRKHR